MFIQLKISKWAIAPATALATIVAMPLLMTATPAAAQSDDATLEEIIVTSRRYAESIEDAPVAVGVTIQ